MIAYTAYTYQYVIVYMSLYFFNLEQLRYLASFDLVSSASTYFLRTGDPGPEKGGGFQPTPGGPA